MRQAFDHGYKVGKRKATTSRETGGVRPNGKSGVILKHEADTR